MIGGFATGVHYMVLLSLVEGLHVTPSLAAASGAVCGALVAYAGNRQFTFRHGPRHRTALPRFLLVAALGAALNGGGVWAGTAILGWHYLVAQIAATLVVLLITYGCNRTWTFA
ncbi:MAG: GtrA family protein [Betaproteobacteria bacterium]|nr:GtrA family protein [Betaproteobacteria bacterium]